MTELDVAEQVLERAGGLHALNGRLVVVTVARRAADAAGRSSPLETRVIRLAAPDEVPAALREAAQEPLTGAQPRAVILCRFSDSPGVTPNQPGYFTGLMSASAPGLNHYWGEVSYGNINLDGTQVFGWYNLPNPRSYYVYVPPGGSTARADLGRAVRDCTAAADADVYFPNFKAFDLNFNQELDCCAWGGGTTVSLDGVTRTYGVTWMPPWAQNTAVYAHETGHSLGFPHSSGPYTYTYDSKWDPMSSPGAACRNRNPTYGCVPVHTIMYHKDLDLWIPPARRYDALPNSSATLTIERSAQPGSSGYLAAKIPIGASTTNFYTVEARRFVGYDTEIPGEAIVIHNVLTTRTDRVAQVVDATLNNDANDAGAMWTPGESFVDVANGITVTVNSASASSHSVTISRLLSVSSLTANVSFPVVAGTPITWTAAAGSGGIAPYSYQFWVFNGSAWTIGRDWSASNTWIWEPPAGGNYVIQVWVRNAGSGNAYDAWLSAGATIATPSVLTVTSVTPSATAVTAGSPVTWTATAAGGSGPYSYKFFVWDGAAWTVGQEWSASSAWTWTPPAAGTYGFQVWARNAGSAGAGADAWRSFGPMTVRVPGTLTVTGLTANRASPVPSGTPVTWTASAIGGTGPYTYKFYVFDGASWSVGQDWNASKTWTWIPPSAGSYTVQVWMRNAGSVAAYDAWRGAGTYTVTAPAALSVTGLSADRVLPVPAGTPVTWEATATGGAGPYTYKFYVFNGSAWTIGQDWSAANTWTWVPPAAGTYSIQVWARNAGSAAVYDAWLNAGPVSIGGTAPLSVASLTAAPGAPLVAGAPVSISATATGGTGPYTYQFWVYNGATWSVGRAWSGSNTFTWTPAAGTYSIQVWIRNAGSSATWDAWSGIGPLTVVP